MIRTLATALATSTCIVALATPAAAQTREYNVPAGSLKSALDAYVRLTGRQVVYRADQVRLARSQGARGKQSAEAALAAILAGSGFTTRVDGELVAIVRVGNAPIAAATDEQNSAEIVVTGTNIRGVKVAAPTIRIGRGDIDKSGYSSIEQVFETLPQNFSQVSPAGLQSVESASILSASNYQRATAIDLRGLGAQSTLTLVNGSRRAGSIGGRVVDISNIPLSIIERVEIVSGGRSAIYGADAVAGVVNLVTRRSFDGFDTQALYGFANDGGGERLRLSQIAGIDGDKGGFIAGYEFMKDWSFDAADVDLLSQKPGRLSGVTQLGLTIQAPTERHSAYLSGHIKPTGDVEFFGELMYSNKAHTTNDDTLQPDSDTPSTNDFFNRAKSFSASGGADINLGADWSARFTGTTSSVDNYRRARQVFQFSGFSFSSDLREAERSTSSGIASVVDGRLTNFAGLTVAVATGAEWRRESFIRNQAVAFDLDAPTINTRKGAREVLSLFAEASVPFPTEWRLGRLELSLAGRYDRYSDVGDTFNPQFGLLWEPARGLILRGTYASSFRAPSIIETLPNEFSILELATDPERGGRAVPVLFRQGVDTAVGPEKAKTWTLGFDYRPSFVRDTKLSISYLNVEYDGRIEQPVINIDRSFVLERADRYPGLISRQPTPAELAGIIDSNAFSNGTGTPFEPSNQDALSVFPELVVFDNRTTNLANEKLQALDASFDSRLPAMGGVVSLGVNATYTIKHGRSVTVKSPPVSLSNSVGKPADLRLRGNAGYASGRFSVDGFVNHVNGYPNPFGVSSSRISAWTTVDLSVTYNGSSDSVNKARGLSATLSINNVFNRKAPYFGDSLLGLLYDASNANPFGRFVALRVASRW